VIKNNNTNYLDIRKLLPHITLGIFVLFLIGVILIYRTFLIAFFIAAIYYILFRNVHKYILHLTRDRKSLASLVSTLLVTTVVAAPFTVIIINLLQESIYIADSLKQWFDKTNLEEIYNQNSWLKERLSISKEDIESIQLRALDRFQSFFLELLNQSRVIISDFFRLLANFFLSIILLFFFFRNGEEIQQSIYQNLPFPDNLKNEIGHRIVMVFDAVVKGNLLIAVLQGVILGLLFWIFQLPTPIVYGTIGAFFGLIPIIGTNIIWIPAAIYLYHKGFIVSTAIFSVLAFVFYQALENVAKPMILDRELHLHPFILFLALLGGLSEFGIKGLIMGPFIVTIFLTLWQLVKLWNQENEGEPDSTK